MISAAINWYQFWCILAFFFMVSSTIPCLANDLAIGPKAKIKSANVPITPAADFNFKTKAEIFALRRAAVMKYPQLINGAYTPDDQTFGQIEDRRPWWGALGLTHFGAGQNSIKGLSIRSPVLLNPFLLVADEEFLYAPQNISEAELAGKISISFPRPSNLNWWPQAKRAEVTYDLSAQESLWNSSFSNFSGMHHTDPRGLSLLNARDLGLPYVMIPPAWASNIHFGSPMTAPKAIPQFIHCGGSCGYLGGCNNESPTTAWLNSFTVEKLPARIGFMFWKLPPKTGREPPDMTFTLNYR